MLDCLWIESRIKKASNGGFCLGVVTAMGAVVHHPSLSSDWLAEVKSSWFGVVTALGAAVHRCGLFGDRLDMAESSSAGVVTRRVGVHRHVHGGAPPSLVRCHRHFYLEAGLAGVRAEGAPPRSPPLVWWCTTLYFSRAAKTNFSEGGHRHGQHHGCGGALPYFSRDSIFWGTTRWSLPPLGR